MKKAKHTHRRIHLSRETIAHLETGDLARAHGAGADDSQVETCEYTYKSQCPHELCPGGIAVAVG